MSKFVNLLFVFLIITVNAYSQKQDCSEHPFHLSEEYIPVFYVDSIIVDGLTVYTDSITMDIVSVDYTDSVEIDGSLIYIGGNVYKVNYPITLTNNPPFKKAIYRGDYCEFFRLMHRITARLWGQQVSKTSDEKGRYYILSSGNKYINYAYMRTSDDDFYTKYNPLREDNNGSFSFSDRQFNKLMNWVQQEMDKGLIVTVGSKNKRTYIAKSFDPTL